LRTAELVSSRELLWNLTLRELRTKYRRSFLGWTWSLINPLATMLIFTFIYAVVFQAKPPTGDPSGLKSYPLYLLCGLLPWNFFALSIATSMQVVVGNGPLVKKVYFPRELLVLSVVSATLVSFLIEMGILSVAFLIVGNMVLPWIPVFLLITVLLTMFTTGIGLIFAAGYVFFRDLSHLWAIVGQAWFYLTPIVYTLDQVPDAAERFLKLNPMALFITAYRDILYSLRFPAWDQMAACAMVGLAVLALGLSLFRRLAPRFAEEL
jgi:ABC-type polysaccharide/polyol phosphate export permease